MPKPTSHASVRAKPNNWFAQLVASRGRELIAAAVLILLTCAVYLPAMSGSFIMDDDMLLTQNRLVRAPNGLYRIWFTTEPMDYWPLTNTTLWLEWRLWGMNSTGYHLTNLALHILDSLLIWLVLRKLAVPGAFLAALLFTVHPVNVESVAWIAQRKNLLAMLFFVVSILCYLQSENERPPAKDPRHGSLLSIWYCLSLLAFLLAMLSKGSVAVLPVVLLLLIWWKRSRIGFHDFIRVSPHFLLAVLLVGMNIWFQTHGDFSYVLRQSSFVERLLGAGAVVWFYLSKAIVPVHLTFIYPQWEISAANPIWWLPLAATIGVTMVLWSQRRTRWGRPLMLAWGYFCIALLPVMGFTDVAYMQHSLVADHYQHLALIGVVAVAAAGWTCWAQQASGQTKPAAILAATIVVGTFAVLTWRQSGLYAGPTTLYEATVQSNPNCWLAYNMLGRNEADAGNADEAITRYEQALKVNPNYSDAHFNLAIELYGKGRLPESIAHYEEAIRLGPDTADLRSNYAMALLMAGRSDDSLAQLIEALRVNPNDLTANYNLTSVYARRGQLSAALAVAQHALSLAQADGNADMIARIQAQLHALHEMMSQGKASANPSANH